MREDTCHTYWARCLTCDPQHVEPFTGPGAVDRSANWASNHIRQGHTAEQGCSVSHDPATCFDCTAGIQHQGGPAPEQLLTVLDVPDTGHVIFVLHLAPSDSAESTESVVEAVAHVAGQAAPGRSTAVVLAAGASFEILTEEELAAAGLRRVLPPLSRLATGDEPGELVDCPNCSGDGVLLIPRPGPDQDAPR